MLPPYPIFPVLNAGKYTLRAIEATDLKDILDILFFEGKRVDNVVEAQTILDKIDGKYLAGEGINWGIEDPESRTIIGSCGFYRGFEGNAGEVGFILNEAFRRKGIMRQAITAICHFGKEVMKLDRIFAVTRNENTIAQKFLEELGFHKLKELESGMLEYELYS